MANGPSDSLIAFKVICLSDDLSPTSRRVAAALIEHFNRRTGRCDPSLARLAALLGVDRRTIIRAVRDLVKKGYVVRTRHGGYNHRNSYSPCWTFFRKKQNLWRSQWAVVGLLRTARFMSHLKGQNCPLGEGKVVDQTSSINITKKTYPKADSISASDSAGPRQLASNPNSGLPPRFKMPRLTTSSSAEAAIDSAERRWTAELTNMLASNPKLFGEILDAITDQMKSDATEAELHSAGGGLRLILRCLDHLLSGLNGLAK
ncbi:helix-turn-helix domain-containing protein [Bradyrhizobium sp. AUGA SZCCT0222]|uniref:helix-turn-helix domain-containing protein n=1 Tax=Bradyrhizobium sp. AUGA SZCCT0222 TaxID=2807668 RepID=UPI001BA46986|nr:helix-turn-helix domain-containing protein [Bradyrhizobium sp. AUGA SZCCT0222]MBR1271597.1 helix-turn-helix domain-containing protein [Bradyrhizobium sp. AUGA SZCCT0222]